MGSFANLQAMIGKLSRVPSQVARGASDGISAAIQAEFDAGTDPFGDEWAPLEPVTIDKGRFPPPLTDTHAMRDGIEVKPLRGAGISVTIPDPGVHHQYGTKYMVARPIFPDRMPDTWQRAIADSAEEAFTRAKAAL
jgi:hypothetical protein